MTTIERLLFAQNDYPPASPMGEDVGGPIPPKGRILKLNPGELPMCKTPPSCDDETELAELKYLEAGAKEAVGKFVKARGDAPAPLKGKFDYPPYPEAGTKAPRSDIRFDIVNAYYYSTFVFLSLSKYSAVMQSFGRGEWRPLDIVVGVLNMCNAYFSPLEHKVALGVCQMPNGKEFSTAYDPTVIMHETLHSVYTASNPFSIFSFSPEIPADNESFADVLTALITGIPFIGRHLMRFLAMATEKSNDGYLRRVDNNSKMNEGTSEEPHERSLPYSRFYWSLVTFLIKKGAPPEKAREAVRRIVEEHVPFLKGDEASPYDIVAATYRGTMQLNEERLLDDVMPPNFNKNWLYTEIVQSAIRIGLISMQEFSINDIFENYPLFIPTPQETNERGFETIPETVKMAGGRELIHHQELHKIQYGLLAGKKAVVRGHGWSEYKYKNGLRRVISSNLSPQNFNYDIVIKNPDAAFSRINQAWLKQELLRQGLKPDTVTHVMSGVTKLISSGRSTIIAAHRLAFIGKKGTINYEFKIGPLLVFVDAKDGALTLARTVVGLID